MKQYINDLIWIFNVFLPELDEQVKAGKADQITLTLRTGKFQGTQGITFDFSIFPIRPSVSKKEFKEAYPNQTHATTK